MTGINETVNETEPEVPPFGVGLKMVMFFTPVVDTSDAGILAVSCEEEINVVVFETPPTRTTEELTKPVPFTVSVKALAPVETHAGEIVEITGVGLLTRKELLTPVEPEVAVIVNVPPGLIVIDLFANKPAENAEVVPPPLVSVPVDVNVTIPVKTLGPELHLLFSISLAVI